MWLNRSYASIPPPTLDSDHTKIAIDMKGRLMCSGLHDPLVALQCLSTLFSRYVGQFLKHLLPYLNRWILADPLGQNFD